MAESTKQHIIKTFLNLSQKKSPEKISVSAIMTASNMQRETFYYYFTDRECLIKDTLTYLLFDSFSHLLKNESLSKVNKRVLEMIKENRNFCTDLLSPRNEFSFKMTYCHTSVEVMHAYLLENFGAEISKEDLFAIKLYAYGQNSIMYEWLDAGAREPVDELVNLLDASLPARLQQYFKTNTRSITY
ncbi:TetR-like C-terminal domain-containing protein [Paucilactobacillus nenjiangensis]|uniref:TetR/AcrR family transcriptional regulator n=2 Tax=Paucilactobacillus nenjiangensis TaxID=1296540 RepID=UPI0028D5D8B2|nr:TetR-like C-terminal domain-containing protein [Paucilactobacillus nenjiangensis]